MINKSSSQQGVTYSSLYEMWSKYAPPLERTRMAGFAMAGSYVGTVVAMLLSGVFAVHFGWESIFYIFGSFGIIWCVVWVSIVKRSPQDDHNMSDQERNYIIVSLGNQKNELPKFSDSPWKEIFTSSAVWAIVVAHFCESWGFFTLLTQLPSFMKG